VSRDCPQAGVLSPLLWCFVADDMIERLNKGWCILSTLMTFVFGQWGNSQAWCQSTCSWPSTL
jgi:hypothetical protein